MFNMYVIDLACDLEAKFCVNSFTHYPYLCVYFQNIGYDCRLFAQDACVMEKDGSADCEKFSKYIIYQ